MMLNAMENRMANDRRGFFTIISIASTFGMFINSITISSFLFGALFSAIYLLINSVFLGRLFFNDESVGFRVAFGSLVLIMLIPLGSAIIIVGNGLGFLPTLDMKATISVLISITLGASLSNHLKDHITRIKKRFAKS